MHATNPAHLTLLHLIICDIYTHRIFNDTLLSEDVM
jgi:hypothetical protein